MGDVRWVYGWNFSYQEGRTAGMGVMAAVELANDFLIGYLRRDVDWRYESEDQQRQWRKAQWENARQESTARGAPDRRGHPPG